MRRVAIRELNHQTAKIIARVEQGERVLITRNGTCVAIIEPAQPDPLSALIEAGDLRPARGPLPLVSVADAPVADSAGCDAVLEDRYGSERW
jgi:prevent-host-death family protein